MSKLWLTIYLSFFIVEGALANRRLVPHHKLKELILNDLKALPPARRKFARYLSLAHFHNQMRGREPVYSDADMRTFRFGVSKAVNSFSWNSRIIAPRRVAGSQGTLLRIFIDDYSAQISSFDKPRGLNEINFDVMAIFDPYGLNFDDDTGQAIERLCGTIRPLMRADYFIVKATEPDFYRRMMGLDRTTSQLETAFLGNTLEQQIRRRGRIVRAGFSDSGVAFNNRLIERHTVETYGNRELSLWATYDFEYNLVTSSIFSNVVGPIALPGGYRQNLFRHVAGEFILELPNNLHAFWLNQAGKRSPIDAAPIDLVRDPKRGAVQSPISCFDCHQLGIIRREDHVRPIVESNWFRYSPTELEFVRRVFPDPETNDLSNVFDRESSRYQRAIGKLEIPYDNGERSMFEPITTMWDLFHGKAITREMAAAEFGLTPKELVDRLSRNHRQLPVDYRNLEHTRGTINRDEFADSFHRAMRDLRAESPSNKCSAILTRHANRP